MPGINHTSEAKGERQLMGFFLGIFGFGSGFESGKDASSPTKGIISGFYHRPTSGLFNLFFTRPGH